LKKRMIRWENLSIMIWGNKKRGTKTERGKNVGREKVRISLSEHVIRVLGRKIKVGFLYL